MTFSLVIARYNEDVVWIDKINKIDKNNIYIYNKNDDKYEENIYKNIMLPNIGRESHTYLTHIINNYNCLTDYVIFCQGKFDDHIGDNFDVLFDRINIFDIKPYNKDFRIYAYRSGSLVLNKDDFTFGQWMEKYIEKDINEIVSKKGFFCNYGAIFCIKKENILSRPIEFYKQLLQQQKENNTEVGHFFERAWFYIFNIHQI